LRWGFNSSVEVAVFKGLTSSSSTAAATIKY